MNYSTSPRAELAPWIRRNPSSSWRRSKKLKTQWLTIGIWKVTLLIMEINVTRADEWFPFHSIDCMYYGGLLYRQTFLRHHKYLTTRSNFCILITMSRRPYSMSPSESPRLSKKPRLDHLTSEDFKDGVFLAPMVRSGACMSFLNPSSLFSFLCTTIQCLHDCLLWNTAQIWFGAPKWSIKPS